MIPIVRVQEADFDPGEELAALGGVSPDVGAVVSFTGLVRADPGADGAPLAALTLEHYPGMTERELSRIAQEAGRRFTLKGALIVHRVGRLPVGARIVFVAASAGHRQAAFEGADFMMDFLKTDAPFWKREETAAGPGDWIDARTSDTRRRARWQEGAP